MENNLTKYQAQTPSLNSGSSLAIIPNLNSPAQIVFDSRSKQICKFKEADVTAFLVGEIIKVCDFLNVPSMSKIQVMETVRLVLKEAIFTNYKPEDFVLCFDNAKMGKYGKSYNRIDGQIIFEWLWQYESEREESIIKHNLEKKDGIIVSEHLALPTGRKLCDPQKLADLAKSLFNKKDRPLSVEQQKRKWEVQFARIHTLQNQKDLTIQINETIMNVHEYIEYKMKTQNDGEEDK